MILFHVHDEVICEVETMQAEASLEEMKAIMGTPINWAPGLGLPAAGYISSFYLKD
jgi:DNA polymerase